MEAFIILVVLGGGVYLFTRGWFWGLLLLGGLVFCVLSAIACIIHFQIFGAMGMLLLAIVFYSLIEMNF